VRRSRSLAQEVAAAAPVSSLVSSAAQPEATSPEPAAAAAEPDSASPRAAEEASPPPASPVSTLLVCGALLAALRAVLSRVLRASASALGVGRRRRAADAALLAAPASPAPAGRGGGGLQSPRSTHKVWLREHGRVEQDPEWAELRRSGVARRIN
jgi:hypothetical protein